MPWSLMSATDMAHDDDDNDDDDDDKVMLSSINAISTSIEHV